MNSTKLLRQDRSAINTKPRQAVILAGGRGTRLGHLTENCPKPMVLFHGNPFLEFLLTYLKNEGIDRVILLLGYLPDKVMNYFGDGSRIGLKIEYSVTDVENDTGPRLAAIKNQVDPVFLMLYCDNYCPLNTDQMWSHFVQQNKQLQITVYGNSDNYTRNNLQLQNGEILNYDKSRTAPLLNGVDIGFAYMRASVLDLIPEGNVNFEKAVYPQLVKQGQLAGFLTHHRYYSVGTIERLPLTEKFLKREPVIFLDRDGVLNQRAAKGEYITHPKDFRWIEGSKEAVVHLKKKGYKVVLISNQAGIARGHMRESDLAAVHQKMQEDLAQHGAKIDAIYFCPHGWDEGCECRKPKPGMLFQAQREHSIDLTRTYFIGDDERDIQAGQSAGCKTYLFKTDDNLQRVIEKLIKE